MDAIEKSAPTVLSTLGFRYPPMPVELNKHVQGPMRTHDEWLTVSGIADQLHEYLNRPEVLDAIALANQPGASSVEIQAIFLDFAKGLGFESEKKGLFADLDLAVRPDCFLSVGQTGILLEVERGKTTINNMDFLDFWKCHLCPGANYLFLLVPKALRQNQIMRPRNEFQTVDRRLAKFFVDGNYTNVLGLCLFGY